MGKHADKAETARECKTNTRLINSFEGEHNVFAAQTSDICELQLATNPNHS